MYNLFFPIFLLATCIAVLSADEQESYGISSQKLTLDWNSLPVKVLVASNFHEIVYDKSKTVFVMFYAPYSGHCKQLLPKWERLAKIYESNPEVVIAKIDGTQNELSDFKTRNFPSFTIWPAGSNTPVVYDGDRIVEKFEEFINKFVLSDSVYQEL